VGRRGGGGGGGLPRGLEGGGGQMGLGLIDESQTMSPRPHAERSSRKVASHCGQRNGEEKEGWES
jgi:hypothetical protein